MAQRRTALLWVEGQAKLSSERWPKVRVVCIRIRMVKRRHGIGIMMRWQEEFRVGSSRYWLPSGRSLWLILVRTRSCCLLCPSERNITSTFMWRLIYICTPTNDNMWLSPYSLVTNSWILSPRLSGWSLIMSSYCNRMCVSLFGWLSGFSFWSWVFHSGCGRCLRL